MSDDRGPLTSAEFEVMAPDLATARQRASRIADHLVGDDPYTLDIAARPAVTSGDGAIVQWTFECSLTVLGGST